MADQNPSLLPLSSASWPQAKDFTYTLQSGTRYTVSVRAVQRFIGQSRRLPGGCWVLQDQRSGYARFKLAGYWTSAHRFSYTAFVGPIPGKLDLDHLCSNAACVRPSHLEPVTKLENQRRRAHLAAMVAHAAIRAARLAVQA